MNESGVSTEPTDTPSASEDRFFEQDGQWYFRARGDNVAGPFASREEAERSLARHMRSWRSPDTALLEAPLRSLRQLIDRRRGPGRHAA